MPKFTFNKTYIPDDARKGTKQERRYIEGQTYDLSQGAYDHCLRRGLGGPPDDAAPAKPAKEKAPKPDKADKLKKLEGDDGKPGGEAKPDGDKPDGLLA